MKQKVVCDRCKIQLELDISLSARKLPILCKACLKAVKTKEKHGEINQRWQRMLDNYRANPLNPYRY